MNMLEAFEFLERKEEELRKNYLNLLAENTKLKIEIKKLKEDIKFLRGELR